MMNLWQREQDAYEGFVGSQSVEEFMSISAEKGQTTIAEAVADYVRELRASPHGVGLTVDDIPDDLTDLLSGYIRRSLGRDRYAYGIAEIAEALGVRRQAVALWHHRGQLPPPSQELAMGPIWTAEVIEPWVVRRVAESLLAEIESAEAAEEPGSHDAPGEVASRSPHVPQDVFRRMDPGHCGWVIPVRTGSAWAVLAYYPGVSWQIYAGRDIPDWIHQQLPTQ